VSRRLVTIGLLLIVCAVTAGAIEFPALPAIISAAVTKVNPDLVPLLASLKQERAELLAKAALFDKACGHVAAGSAQDAQCGKDFPVLAAASERHSQQSAEFMKAHASAAETAGLITRTISSMSALARRLGWEADELQRVNTALNSLAEDGDLKTTGAKVVQAWSDVLARGQDAAFAREASRGDGPALFDAGAQTRFEDCTIFALATAAGLPYDVAAARATKLIGEGEWRNAAERANPQKVIEQHGLNGGEVVMLAEAFGQASVVPSSAFGKTLKDGQPLLINVFPYDGNLEHGHEVVLTKAFQHDGQAWFEMIDSNQGPQRHLYVSGNELHTMLQENGVTIRRDPKMTPQLLR
jgi:hypothetical protein